MPFGAAVFFFYSIETLFYEENMQNNTDNSGSSCLIKSNCSELKILCCFLQLLFVKVDRGVIVRKDSVSLFAPAESPITYV